jgi:trigger factor
MKVLAESSKDLRHEFKIEIPSQEIESQVEKSLLEYGKEAKIPGFRPGKIPLNILRQRYDASARKDAVESAVKKSIGDVITEKKLHPATSPKIDMTEYKQGTDLTLTVAFEVLPEFKLQDVTSVKVSKLVVKLTDKDIDEHLMKLLEAQKRTSKVTESRKSKKGDTVVLNATASHPTIDASEQGFEDFHLELGSGRLDDFEKSLSGKNEGDVVDIDFTLPEAFPNREFAGKTLSYKTTIKELREPMKMSLTEEVAKEFGFKDLAELRAEAKSQLEQSIDRPSFLYSKRQILDGLAKQYSFQVPEGLLEQEFEIIWDEAEREINHEVEHDGRTKPSEKEIATLKKKYRELAERRVRLGLVLSEIAKENKVTVPKEKIAQAVMQAAKQHKGYEKEAFEYYFKNPEANAQIRAPLLEDEVMHFLLTKIQVKDKEVNLDQFKAELDKLTDE